MSVDVAYVPDLAREAAFELIDSRWFTNLAGSDRQAFAFFQLPNDYLDVGADKASVALYTTGGNRGDWERTDRLTVDVYAPGTDAVLISEAISDLLVNDLLPHDLQAGYVDEFQVDVTPHDVPFPADVNQAQTVYLVTHRPQ